ncbi:MAG: c-type cytochrome [Dechloromonas sp.]|uniref:C-type cytochrome n=1 Tax=Candidatus Dechloromonas phosphorivorans TaxID=2899244 RepID=A0A935JUK0_9RHOO|nr:c-type cytochrome [Candidatus Dechloromonas phosphorivorans]
MRTWLLAAGLLVISGVASAQTPLSDRLKSIQSDPAALKSALDAGRKASSFCANCHGEEGVSKSVEIPNLAGQNPAFLLEQIRKFASGERKDAFMQGLIKILKDEERLQIALYYAGMSVPPSRADAAQAAKGKELFGKLCVRCHGDQARGNAEIPRIAGQKLSYLQTTLMRYRDGTGIRNYQLMAIATGSLKNEDITAIANFLTQLP